MIEGRFSETVNIQREVLKNVEFVATRKPTIVMSDCPCHIQEKKGEIKVNRGTTALEYDASAWLPFGIDLRPNGQHGGETDVLIVTSSGDGRIPVGMRYSVLHAMPSPGVASHVRAYLMRLPGSTGDG